MAKMEMEELGFIELSNDMAAMARTLSGEHGSGWKALAGSILQEAAQPVLASALRHASPPRIKIRSGNLQKAIKVGRVVPRKGKSGYSISIGNQPNDGVGYARPLEFGHGGPKPAGKREFMQPAYADSGEQAYAIIRRRLAEEIDKIGR